ncbi:MAG: hypothetical protein ACT4PZ_24730 [Panacagrimonas sp.]
MNADSRVSQGTSAQPEPRTPEDRSEGKTAGRPVLSLSWEQRVKRASRTSWSRVEQARAASR